MKITTITSKSWYDDDSDGGLQTLLKTDDYSGGASFSEGEPEDMTLSRDLSDAYEIADMLVAAYEAGKRGETLEIVSLEEDD